MKNTTARSLSVLALSGAALLTPLAAAAGGPAAAATATGTVEVHGDTIVFRAAPGDANALTITDDKNGHITIFEQPPALNPITSRTCTQDNASQVTCDAEYVTRIVLHLRDRDDLVFTDIPYWMPSASYTVYGGRGDDYLGGNGGGYADQLYGQAGDDRLKGYSGHDVLAGGGGDDTVIGGSGDDVMRGDAGADTMRGGDGSDTVFGGVGADRLTGGGGVDTLTGGRGDDRLFAEDYTVDYVYGGAGADAAATDPEDIVASVESLL